MEKKFNYTYAIIILSFHSHRVKTKKNFSAHEENVFYHILQKISDQFYSACRLYNPRIQA